MTIVGIPPQEGERIGRFVVLRDPEGRLHAIAATSVSAICETDDGVVLLLPGGRMMKVEQDMATVLEWLERSR